MSSKLRQSCSPISAHRPLEREKESEKMAGEKQKKRVQKRTVGELVPEKVDIVELDWLWLLLADDDDDGVSDAETELDDDGDEVTDADF